MMLAKMPPEDYFAFQLRNHINLTYKYSPSYLTNAKLIGFAMHLVQKTRNGKL